MRRDLLATYRARYRGLVHQVSSVPFRGAPGHHYFLPHRYRPRADFRELSQITDRSDDAEVSLVRFNGVHIVSVGNRNHGSATLIMPPRGTEGVEDFEWIAHTHPRDQENDQQRILQGASEEDRRALDQVFRAWGQTESTVVVCRGPRTERVVRFAREVPEAFPGGRLWSPGR
jgi:hypothetical protein